MRIRVAGAVVTVAAGAAVALAGCGSSGGSGSGGAPAAQSSTAAGSYGPASPSGAGSGATTPVTVTATEFRLSLPSTHLAPGTYAFTMDNAGHATHAIEIRGPGVDGQMSGTAGPGGTATLTVTLQPGTYELWCPVGNHRAEGMQTTLTVG
jgi:plastocyanin